MSQSQPTAIVVGAGLGGLATAIRLAAQGYTVRVLERLPRVGGRAHGWEAEGFRFDTGPTLLLMIDHLRAVFEAVGRRLEDYLQLVQLEPNYRVNFADGSAITLTSRLNTLLAEAERIEPGSGPQLLRYLAETQDIYQRGMKHVVERNFRTLREFLTLTTLTTAIKARALQRLYPWVSTFFRDERLRVAMSFQSMYLGMNPFDGPALYSLLPFTELGLGLYFPMGGMSSIAHALARLARELGATIRCGTEVVHVEREGQRVTGVRLADGTLERADVVVLNADLPYAYRELLKEPHPRQERFQYTGSAFLLYLGVKRAYPQLLHHNLYVPRDFRRSMDAVFRAPRVPDDPAYYICNPNKTDASLAPPGHENLFVLVPTAHEVDAIDWRHEGPRFRDAMLERMEAQGLTGLRDNIVCEKVFTPRDLRIDWNAERGAAFGLAHGLGQIGYLRPHNRHATLNNLYFVGASTHPGTGVPMVLISGRLVAERIAQEQPRPAGQSIALPEAPRQEAA